MKKLLFFLCCTPLFWACSNSDESLTPNNNGQETEETVLPSTEVYVQGLQLFSEGETRAEQPEATTRYGIYGSSYPKVNAEEGWEVARFTIRIDGVVTDYFDKNAAQYFGKGTNNLGKVKTFYPYGHYNDRDLDYEKIDKKTGENIGKFRYVWDPQGLQTQLAILEYPASIKAILQYDYDNKLGNFTKANQEKLKSYLEKDEEWLNTHVLWYVVKEVGMKNGWHVNGVFVDDPVVNANLIPYMDPNNVEIDIHQQEHKDWNEIKTSVHVRVADVESVTINLPLSQENIVEQDDFDIRVYDYYCKTYESLQTKITHDEKGVTIQITNINPDMIKELKESIQDGLTIEVHTYCLKAEGVWEELKKSKVTTGKPCTLKGQVTNAFNDERVELYR